jgi:hypothetical protein
MRLDDNDKLWELLGKSQRPAVSPFFARNVLRTVRQEADARPGFYARAVRSLRRWTWQTAIAGGCVIAVLIALPPGARQTRQQSAPAPLHPEAQLAANSDYEVIAHLDELVPDEENSIWLDDSVH